MKVFILCQHFLDYDSLDKIIIGGIQTYILNLSDVIKDRGYESIVIQYANIDKTTEYNGITVIGVNTAHFRSDKRKNKELYNKFLSLSSEEDVIIYATESLTNKVHRKRSLAIQHGISWDIKSDAHVSRLQNVKHTIIRAVIATRLTYHVSKVDKLVCVDYNYLNWYRTQVKHPEVDCCVIPNFTKLMSPRKEGTAAQVTIIFARRFQPYRGTRVFSDAIARIFKNGYCPRVVFAGEGPDENVLKERFLGNHNVEFIRYQPEQSLEIHSSCDIAVVPTVGSEGTSLSLLEAMASGCAVVCSNVGGMTNIVIDRYNGLMISPEVDELYFALKELLDDNNLRNDLSQKAFETVEKAFSYELWKSRWQKVLDEVVGE